MVFYEPMAFGKGNTPLSEQTAPLYGVMDVLLQ